MLIVIALGLVGLLLQLRRFVGHAGAATVVTLTGIFADLEPWVMLMACGIVPLITGMVLFIRFLREYPLVSNEDDEA